VPDLRCGACGNAIEPSLSLCARCGAAVPAHADQPRCLVIRSAPEHPAQRRRGEHILALGGDASDLEEIRRQLDNLPAVFRLPVPDIVTSRLVQDLAACGYEAQVLESLPERLGSREYLQWILAKPPRLIPYAATGGLAVLAAATGAAWSALLLAGAAWLWWAVDRKRFVRRITLDADRLARRMEFIPGEILRPVGAVLQGHLSHVLRSGLGSVVTEHAKLLGEVRAMAADYPDVVGPLRHGCNELTTYAARIAEKAAAIEQAGDFDDPKLPERLRRLRAARSEEVEQRLLLMDAAREERSGRMEWLSQVHATLIVRLEAVADAMRSLRQRTLETRVMGMAEGAAALNALLGDVQRELTAVAGSVREMERLEARLAEEVVVRH